MTIAAYSTALKVSGAANAVTGEATTSLGGGRYQVTSTSRRIWDPAVAVVVKDGGSPVPAANYSFNYLFGIVTFSVLPSGAVTIDGSYLSMLSVLEGRSFEFAASRDLADSSVFGTQAKLKTPTLGDVECSMEILSSPLEDLDTGTGGTQSLNSYLEGESLKVFEVNLGSGTLYLRAFVLLSKEAVKAAPGDVVGTTITMNGAEQRGSVVWSSGT